MKLLGVIILSYIMLFSVTSQAAILIESSSGGTTPAASMAAACAQSNPVHITSALSSTFSNISSASGSTCSAPLYFEGDGSLGNTTLFQPTGDIFAGDKQIFKGTGKISGMKFTRPVWHGVVSGDGTTDNSAAMNAAFNALASGGVINIQPGIYTTKNNFLPPSNITITGPRSAVFKAIGTFATDEIVLVQTGVTGVRIEGITIDGNAIALGGVQLRGSYNTLDNIEVKNTTHENISINGTNGTAVGNTVTHCYSHDIPGSIGWGISMFQDCQYNIITNNVVSNAGAYHIIVDDGTSSPSPSKPSNHNIINGNVLISGTGAGWGISIEGSSYNSVNFNTMYLNGATYGLLCDTSNSMGYTLPSYNTFNGNIVHGVVNGGRISGLNNSFSTNKFYSSTNGLVVSTTYGSTTSSGLEIDKNSFYGGSGNAIQIDEFDHFKVTNNTVYSGFTTGVSVVALGSYLDIKNNSIYSTTSHSILIGQRSLTDFTISGNSIYNTQNQSYGILVDSTGVTIKRGIVSNNVFSDSQAVPTMRAGLYGNNAVTNVYGSGNVSLTSSVPVWDSGSYVTNTGGVYANNTAALAGGLAVGMEYQTSTGAKMIVY